MFYPNVTKNNPITNFLLTEREVCTEKHRTEVLFVQTEPEGRGLYKKTEIRYFSVHTEQARLVKSLLIYGIYAWNKQEMHDLKCILVAWNTVCQRKQKIPMYSFFSTKNQDVFALPVPSCCDKSETSCYHLVTRSMTVTDLLQVVPTRLIQAVFVTSCCELFVIDLLTTCCVQTISELLEKFVASLLAW
jgi:hypothetical protein